MSEPEDDFLTIINNNDLSKLQEESEIYNMSVRDIVVGMRYISEAMMILTDFVDSYFMAISEEIEDRPGFTTESIIHAKNIFDSCKAFSESMLSEDYVSFDDDDDDDDDCADSDDYDDEDGVDDDDDE